MRYRPLRLALGFLLAVVAWASLRVVVAPREPFVIELAADHVVRGSVRFDTWGGVHDATVPISVEDVSVPRARSREVSVSVTPTGTRNARSQAAEVWIFRVESDASSVTADTLVRQAPTSWRRSGQALVHSTEDTEALSARLSARAWAGVRLLAHPYSGRVRVDVDDASKMVDLYSPEPREVDVRLPLALSGDALQRVSVLVPTTASSISLQLSGSPERVRIVNAHRGSVRPWKWPSGVNRGLVAGRGARIVDSGASGTVVELGDSGGTVDFGRSNFRSFWLPNSREVLLLVVLIAACCAAVEGTAGDTAFGRWVRERAGWLAYSALCAGVWFLYWLAFFPGLTDPDALSIQWSQIVTGKFWDWFPVAYTYFDWLVTRLWYSPAAISLAQLLLLAVAIGIALGSMSRLGVPRWITWLVCAACAFSPVLGFVSITPWKDVPYAMGILLVTIGLVLVVASRGAWLAEGWRSLAALVAPLLVVALFRHEGIVVAVAVVACIGVAYRAYWRQVLIVLVVVVSMYALVRGPGYEVLNVRRADPLSTPPLMHHVAAVLADGTPITSEEEAVLAAILPIDRWKASYHPQTWDVIYYGSGFNKRALARHSDEFKRIWLALVLRNPVAVAESELSKSQMVWRVAQAGWSQTVPPGVSPNRLGLVQDNLWPALRRGLEDVRSFTERPVLRAAFWRPAVYLIVFVALITMLVTRTRRAGWVLVAMPVLLHVSAMVLLLPGQYFRYLFTVPLVTLVGLCLVYFVARPEQFARLARCSSASASADGGLPNDRMAM